jgi:uncharacterized protein HemY
MTYSGSAWRILRLRHRLKNKGMQAGLTPLVIVLVLVWWIAVTVWYPLWALSRVSAWTVRRRVRRARRERADAALAEPPHPPDAEDVGRS